MAEGGGGHQLYACDICGQEGLSEDDMRSHVLIEHVEGAISCPFCDLEGTTVDEMNMHVNSEHLDYLTPTREQLMEDEEGGVGHSMSVGSDLQNCNGFSDGTGSDSGGGGGGPTTNKSSDSASVSGLSSTDTTPDGYSDLPLTPPPVPMEITITTADSPKRAPAPSATPPTNPPTPPTATSPEGVSKTKAGTPPDGEEQLRKRAKLYLDVPPVRPHSHNNHPQDQQHLCKTTANNDNCSSTAAAGAAAKNGVVAGTPDNANVGEEKRDREKSVVPGAATNRTTPTKNGSSRGADRSSPLEAGKQSPLRCPLCAWVTTSPGEIMRHVNAEHLDILSPLSAKARGGQPPNHAPPRTDTENNVISSPPAANATGRPSTSATAPTVFECPICGHTSRSGSALELHVNTKHADILSPAGVAHSSSSSGGLGGVGVGVGVGIGGAPQQQPQQPLQSPMSIASSGDSSLCCPVCGMEFVDTHDLAIHVDGHFSAEHTPGQSTYTLLDLYVP